MAALGTRRRKLIGQRRRLEDEAEDAGGHDSLADLDDDSVTDGSIATDEHDPADDSDTSNIDDASPTSPNTRKPLGNGNGKAGFRRRTGSEPPKSPPAKPAQPAIADTESTLSKLTLADKETKGEELEFDETQSVRAAKAGAPIVVSSSAASHPQPRLPQQEIRRREHEEYKRRRDEDPTFVPNRGAFFLHDHRHAGPAANGFRPFPRGGGARGRGRGGFGSQFPPMSQLHNPSDPITSGMWKHDMHEVVSQPQPPRHSRYQPNSEGPPNGNGIIPTAPMSSTPINRAMSTERHIGNTTIRVYIPVLGEPKLFPGVALKQYTKLPDHRPPLRRDKPVRISIPYHDPPVMPRYIFPASDRSFIFIPRAMRPNQQPRTRTKGPRSVLGSGVFSRSASVWGGSVYGSVYSPSIALSRRSSIAPDIGRDFMLSPTSSAISRPPLAGETARPIVRLPPAGQPPSMAVSGAAPHPPRPDVSQKPPEPSINELPPPQTHPLPPKPAPQDGQPGAASVHQPRPQKTASVENIETPSQPASGAPTEYQQAFHQQVPPQLPNALAQEAHARQAQASASAAAVSHIPERAVHAAPFQPGAYAQAGFYGQPYSGMPPQQPFYYPQPYGTNLAANAPAFVPVAQQQQTQPRPYAQPTQGDASAAPPPAGQPAAQPSVVDARESQGTVYYDYYSQVPPMPGYSPYPVTQPYPAPGMVSMGGMMTPNPETTYYYPQPMPVYYPPHQ
ncbi:hypothetical protein VTJ83DRAFT_3601 [Remersonia thermophila]|uniref:Btz domain-containing protein n=1 Tax=Remersonia thermophila TaxID=72144 RepID=A0ABR4DF23_9PEZI